MKSVFYDEHHQNELDQKGYTKVEFLSPEEVAYILRELRQLRPNNDFAANAEGEWQLTFHDTRMDKDDDYRRKATNLINKVFSPRANQFLKEYEILLSTFFIKPPGQGDLYPHQHPAFTTNVDDTYVLIWCPLVDVGEHNGTLQVIEGSHKIVPGIAAFGHPDFFASYGETIKQCSRHISLKAGEAVICDNNLIHGSDKNHAATPRIVAVGVFRPIESTPVFYYYNPNAPEHFEVFEINNEFYLQYRLNELFPRPNHLRSLGFVQNNARPLSEEEFVALLNSGGKLKPEIHISSERLKSNEGLNILKRIRLFLSL